MIKQEYILAKCVLGLLTRYVPDAVPILAVDLSKVDVKDVLKYLRFFASEQLPVELEDEFKQVNELIDKSK